MIDLYSTNHPKNLNISLFKIQDMFNVSLLFQTMKRMSKKTLYIVEATPQFFQNFVVRLSVL